MHPAPSSMSLWILQQLHHAICAEKSR